MIVSKKAEDFRDAERIGGTLIDRISGRWFNPKAVI
jgi:hypothetical protein